MSYCHNADPPYTTTAPKINFNLGFGPQPGTLIRNKVNNASCLECEAAVALYNTYYGGADARYDNYMLIKVNNTVIQSGARVELEACPGGSVIINSNGFKVYEGATFIV